MDVSGKNKKTLYTGEDKILSNLNIAGDWLYYLDNKERVYYKMKFDGTNRAVVD